jgi:hypothetical protein
VRHGDKAREKELSPLKAYMDKLLEHDIYKKV